MEDAAKGNFGAEGARERGSGAPRSVGGEGGGRPLSILPSRCLNCTQEFLSYSKTYLFIHSAENCPSSKASLRSSGSPPQRRIQLLWESLTRSAMEEVSYLNEHAHNLEVEAVAFWGVGFLICTKCPRRPREEPHGLPAPPGSSDEVPCVSPPQDYPPPARVEPRESNIQIQKRASRTIPN